MEIKMDYRYKCVLVRVVDGDTIDINLDLGFGVWLFKQRVRLMGIDTPESRTRNLAEKELGLASKARLVELLDVPEFTIITHKDGRGKFGRILGEPEVDHPTYGKINICDRMMEEGHARSYYGGKKIAWV
jgi:micrococcal nuclease|tara:strand:+ start:744 stop:1133 length:390 start_codon:yes stop_codon:yes gene_type:complete